MSFPSSPEQGATAAGGSEPAELCGSRLAALGQRLRQVREARGLSADVLADRLRIGVEQLEALESADRQRLPEPVFVIAQARRIGEALQLDLTAELQALRASGELEPRPRPGLQRPPQALQAAPVQPPGDSRPVPRQRPAVGRTLVAAAALLGALAALWAGWRLVGTLRAPQGSARPSASATPSSRPARAAVAAGMVVLTSREPSWVEVRRPDGAILFQGLLRGSRLFSLGQGLDVMAARPDLVSSRIGSAPAEVLGPISEVRWRSLPAGR